MAMTDLFQFPCDVCGSMDAAAIPVVPHYTQGQNLYTCKTCGFVFAHWRRADEVIKRTWAEDMFRGTFDVEKTVEGKHVSYTARVPAVIARLTYAAEFVDKEIGLTGKAVSDVGAGEGDFLRMVRDRKNVASVFGVEPSADNGRILQSVGIDHFVGGIEEFVAHGWDKVRRPDIVTINWTIENSQSARRFMENVFAVLPDGGHLAVATGSRILVPFRKPLHYYFNADTPVDLHAFHFSYNALRNLMIVTGFQPVAHNRFIDTDYLCVIGRKSEAPINARPEYDDYRAVIDFFERWKNETESFYR